MTVDSKSDVEPRVVVLDDEAQKEIWAKHRNGGMPALIGDFNLCFVLDACARTPIAERLRSGVMHESKILAGLDMNIAPHILRYLALKGLLHHKGDTYELTDRGRDLFGEIPLAQLGFYVRAYAPVIGRTGDLLSKEATYGADVQRNGAHLAKTSGVMFHTFHSPTVMEALKGVGTRVLLDLGCGSGRLIFDACLADSELRGIGLDISEGAISVARDEAKEMGLDDRVEFFVADAFDPANWPEVCMQADTLSAVGMLHELFRDGEQAVIDALDSYAEFLKDGRNSFILGEPELRYDDLDNDSDFFLAHALTSQGFPRPSEEWLELIEKSTLRCNQMLYREDAGQRIVFYDLVPRS